jgi:hypothetical protein
VAGYRIYRIGKEGRFVGAHEIHAVSDADAMRQAHQLLDGLDVEVWRGSEKIGYLHGDLDKREQPDDLRAPAGSQQRSDNA